MSRSLKEFEVEMIDISSIQRGPETQIRVALNMDAVDRYTELMKDDKTFLEFPPVDIFRTGEGDILSDGHHRTESASRAGRKQITARVFQGSLDDALWNAFVANQRNAISLTAEDVTRAVEIAVTRWPERSTTDIASAIGCSQSKVSRVKQRLIQEDKLTQPETTVGVDGVERRVPIRKASIKPACMDQESADSVMLSDQDDEDDKVTLRYDPAVSSTTPSPVRIPKVTAEIEFESLLCDCKSLANKLDETLLQAYETAKKHDFMDKYDETYEEIVDLLDFAHTTSFEDLSVLGGVE